MTDFAIYDMDRTITRTGTYTNWLLFWAVRRAPWRLLLLPLAGINGLLFALKIIDRRQVKQLNQLVLMGRRVRRARLAPMVEAYADRVMVRNSLAKAVAQIAADKAEGRRVVLATASHRFYVEGIAKRLGVTDIVATGSVWDSDRLSWRLDGRNCYGADKRKMVEAWLAADGAPRGHVRFYSDHNTDVPMFDWADEPVAVNAHPPLRRVALARHWRIEDWG